MVVIANVPYVFMTRLVRTRIKSAGSTTGRNSDPRLARLAIKKGRACLSFDRETVEKKTSEFKVAFR
jgi:hypothetical protein